MKLNKKRMIIVFFVCVGLLAGYFVYPKLAHKEESTDGKISTQNVKKGNLIVGLTADGRISLSLTNLNFEVSGTVRNINVTNGQAVKAGDVLAELDDTDLRQAVTKAENALQKAKASYTDAVNQRDINIMSQKIKLDEITDKHINKPDDADLKAEYELEKKKYDNLVNTNTSVINAKLSLDEAEDNLDAARENLAKAVLKAPSDGKVINIAFKTGEFVDRTKTGNDPAAAFMVLSDLTVIYTKANITEGDIKGIEIGQQMRISIDAAELENLAGEVTGIKSIPKIDISGIVSYEVSGKLLEPNEVIKDGMSCFINFIRKEKNGVLLIPNRAVFIEDGKQFVHVENSQGEYEKRQITCGLTNGTQTEVVDGLSMGETVVVGGIKNEHY